MNNGKLEINSSQICFNLIETDSHVYPYRLIVGYINKGLSNSGEEINFNNHNNQKLLSDIRDEYLNDKKEPYEFLNPIYEISKNSNFISKIIASEEIYEAKSLSVEEYMTIVREMKMYLSFGICCYQKEADNNRKRLIVALQNEIIKSGPRLSLDNVYIQCISSDQTNGKNNNEELEKKGSTDKNYNLIKNKYEKLTEIKIMELQEIYGISETPVKTKEESLKETIKRPRPEKTPEINKKNFNREEVKNEDWFSLDDSSLTNNEGIKNIDVSSDFTAKLLPYQQQGLNFLYHRYSISAGACLADDIGYEKYSQVIALLDIVRLSNAGKSLLIAPKSKIVLWEAEIKKLAPLLKYKTVKNSKEKPDFEADFETDIFIISPRMACKIDELVPINWNIVILDEARNIKNPNTIISNFVKVLTANCRIALMTNPIENTLFDIWSLFDFLKQGRLGSAKEFSKMAKKILGEKESENLTKLLMIIRPFILRRIQSDIGVPSKLTEIIENKNWVDKTLRQQSQFVAYLNNGELGYADEWGIKSKGISFKIIKNLKDICLHPDIFTAQSSFVPEDCLKFGKLLEIVKSAANKNEKVIIYTTSKLMINPLVEFLEKETLLKGLRLNGELSISKRKAVVDNFNNDANFSFLISTYAVANEKTDLTAANHIVLYDPLWNPLTEKKAIETVHRIKQKNIVNVYKLITIYSIEKLIDEMMDEKLKLLEKIVISTPVYI